MRTRESNVQTMPDLTTQAADDQWAELEPLLDAELSRLPDKYRLPIVLCELEGMTLKAAAQQLGLPEGTVSGRLSRARVMLANRMRRRRLMLSAMVISASITRHAAAVTIPAPLLASTIQSVLFTATSPAGLAGVYPAQVTAIMKGVLKHMFIQKLKMGAATLTILGIGGAGLFMVIGSPARSPAATGILLADATPPPEAASAQSTESQPPATPEQMEKVAAERSAQHQAEADGQASAIRQNPELRAEVESLMKSAQGNLTKEQAMKEIAEKNAITERAARADQQNPTSAQVQQNITEDQAKKAAEQDQLSGGNN